MTPEHTALVARLENSAFSPASPAGKVEREAAAAIRALAGEVERLNASIATLNVFVTEILNERDTLRAEVERLTEDLELQRKIDLQLLSEKQALSKDAERWEWAESHPEAAYGAISRWWAMAGPGYREVRFNFRNVIDVAMAEKPRFTDGRGNSLDHLVEGKK